MEREREREREIERERSEAVKKGISIIEREREREREKVAKEHMPFSLLLPSPELEIKSPVLNTRSTRVARETIGLLNVFTTPR